MANPDFLNTLGDAMGNVYAATHDRLLVNLARHFKYVAEGRYETVGASFRYQARMLADMGQVTSESVDIIMSQFEGADPALRATLEAAILDSVAEAGTELQRAAAMGLLGPAPQPLAPHQMPFRHIRCHIRIQTKCALRPPSMLHTAFREMPLLSATVCCEMLSASRADLNERPSATNISALAHWSRR